MEVVKGGFRHLGTSVFLADWRVARERALIGELPVEEGVQGGMRGTAEGYKRRF
jgi:hypothetical protein